MTAIDVEKTGGGMSRTRGASVNLAFSVIGEGPAIMLLHGTSANHAVWNPIASALASRATVISVDQRGHGRSDKPETGYDGAAFAVDVVTVLDALGIKGAIVAGHSLGARNAWIAAAESPARVSAVLAVDYTPFVEQSVLDTLALRVAAGDRIFANTTDIEDYLHERYPRMPLDAVRRRVQWGYQHLDNGKWLPLAPAPVLKQVVDGLRTPWDREFRDLEVPLTCVRGVDSLIVSVAAWETAQSAHPSGRWVVAEDADHYVPEEHPDVIAAELVRILDNA